MEPLSTFDETPSEKEPVLVRKKQGRGAMIIFLVLTLFSGFMGGLLAPLMQPYLWPGYPLTTRDEERAPSKEKTLVLAEEDLVADLVENNTPGVVSIVISKDVPKVRSYFNSPFGMPFFSPFGSREESTETEKQQIGSGSGFFVSSDGLIVTNKHVVSDEQAEYTVILNDKTEHRATVLARDPSNDIAVIKIEGKDFPVLKLGDSDTIRVGETIIVIGNPLGEFENSVSRGIISGLKRNLEAGTGMGDSEYLSDIIQVDAAINPGNSGGPLFSLEGVVVGVNVAMARGAENIGFALPINQVKRIVEQVRTTGKLSFPYLGVRSITLSDALQKKTGLPYNYGALVVRGDTITDFAVVPGSPADKAGIVENDILLEINGEKIDETHGLIFHMGKYSVGDEVAVKLWHKGDVKEIIVKLEEREQ